MTIYTDNKEKSVLVGRSSVLFSLYSTVKVLLEENKEQIQLGETFLKTGKCEFKNALETARQLNLIRDRLSSFTPDKAIWDYRDITSPAPWVNKLSPIVTSCSNLYTTADGKDLLFELVSLLAYAGYSETDVVST